MSHSNKPIRVRALEEPQQQALGAIFMAKSLSSDSLPVTHAARKASDGVAAREISPRNLVRS